MLDYNKLIALYYADNADLHELLLRHSQEVCNYALSIVKNHPELSLDKDFITEAAMLHDIGIYLCDAPDIYCFGKHQYIEHGYLGADILRKHNLPIHALVCERHTGAGISLETILKNNYPLPHRDMLPVSMEEKLICYADKFFSKSSDKKMLSVEKIRKKLKRFGDEELRKFNALHKLFAQNKETEGSKEK